MGNLLENSHKRGIIASFIKKAYTEGIYSDTPANRKLGRVGMSYKEWTQKQTSKEEENYKLSDLKKEIWERETWYEGELNKKRIRILQQEIGKNNAWNLEIDGKTILNSNNIPICFNSAENAMKELNRGKYFNNK